MGGGESVSSKPGHIVGGQVPEFKTESQENQGGSAKTKGATNECGSELHYVLELGNAEESSKDGMCPVKGTQSHGKGHTVSTWIERKEDSEKESGETKEACLGFQYGEEARY